MTETTRTKSIALDYLQTLQALGNEINLFAVAGIQEGNKQELIFSDQTDLPGTNGGVEVEAHTVGDSGWIKDDTSLITVNDRSHVVVGIRDLKIGSIKYIEKNTFITKPYATMSPIKAVSLRTDEYFPTSLQREQYIFYYISLNNKNWTEIMPINSSLTNTKPTKLTINYDDEEQRTEKITTKEPSQTIYLKIEMTRPTGDEFAGVSPILRHYDLQVEVEV